jgi:hypothetical protein
VIKGRQFGGGRRLGIQDRGDQPVDLVAAGDARHPVLDDAHRQAVAAAMIGGGIKTAQEGAVVQRMKRQSCQSNKGTELRFSDLDRHVLI